MSQLTDNAVKVMNEAVLLETGSGTEALPLAMQRYLEAVTLLKAALQYERMLPDQRTRLEAYTRQVEMKVASMRQQGIQPPARESPPPPSGSPPSATGTAGKSNIVLPVHRRRPEPPKPASGGSVGSAVEPMPSVPTTPPSKSPAAAAAAPKAKPPSPNPPAPPPAAPSAPPAPPKKTSPKPQGAPTAGDNDVPTEAKELGKPAFSRDLVGERYAPRASELVLKAIEKATQLVIEKKDKQGIDILQHAYDVGRTESHNPANFSTLQSTLKELKMKYCREHPPRPMQQNAMLPHEKDIIRLSGQTDQILLPQWDDVDEGYCSENVYLPCKADGWEDRFLPLLTPQQKELKAVWVRPLNWALEDGKEPAIIRDADPLSITQTVVGDCSLVCSLIVCASFQKRFPSANIIGKTIYPQDDDGHPIVNKRGKYCVKMLRNGVTRMVTVDDRLPAVPNSRSLLCSFSSDPTELWVSLIEKAFIKINGGNYDFPGSTSSADLYTLSGWLPDFMAFDDSDFNAAFQWTRLSTCHGQGKLLMTVSTPSKMDPIIEEKLKLIAGHAYAVLEFREVAGNQLVKIKNPWAKQSWQGLFSITDERRCTPEVMEALNFSEAESKQGVFWMSWQDVCKFFSRAHLSWNPYLLYPKQGVATRPVRVASHGTYVNHEGFGPLPQFHIYSNATSRSRFHVVLSRHVRRSKEYSVASDSESSTLPYIAMHLYNTTAVPSASRVVQPSPQHCAGGKCRGRRIYHGAEMPEGTRIHNGVYKNTANQTISFDQPEGYSEFTIIVSQHRGASGESWNFSVTLHTESRYGAGEGCVMMHEIPQASLPYATTKRSAWVKDSNCGGIAGGQTFGFNPQWKFALPSPAYVVCRIHAAVKEPIQLFLVRRKDVKERSKELVSPWDGRVFRLTAGDVSMLLQCPVSSYHTAVVDSSLPQCIVYNGTAAAAAAKPPAEPTQTALASYVVPTVVRVPKHQKELPALFDANSPVEEALSLLLGSCSLLATASVSKVICNQAAIDDMQTVTFGELRQKSPGEVTQQTPLAVVVLLNTEDCPRTQPLSQAERSLMDVASRLLQVRGSLLGGPHATRTQPSEEQGKALIGLNEEVMKLILALDETPAPTDAIRGTRKALVVAAQGLQHTLDRVKSPPSVPGGQPSSPSAVVATGKVADRLPAGVYSVVACTWKKGVPSPFELVFESESESALQTLEEIPAEGAGYNTSRFQGLWSSDNCPGRISNQASSLNAEYHRNPYVLVKVQRKGLVACRLLSVAGTGEEEEPAINVALFAVDRTSGAGELLTMSEGYSPVAGLECLLLPSKEYRLVLSTSNPGMHQKFAVFVHSSGPLATCELKQSS